MTFTDDDLKRLKERLADKVHDSHEDFWPIMHGHFSALIARLEAAEEVISCSIGHSTRYHDFQNAYDAWCKAAGKI